MGSGKTRCFIVEAREKVGSLEVKLLTRKELHFSMSKHFQDSLGNSGDAGLPEEFFNTDLGHIRLKSASIFYEVSTDNRLR